jgi:polar amino acid transport system permease protein
MAYNWHFETAWQYKDAFTRGAVITLELSLLSIVIALVIGTLLGVARVFFPNYVVRKMLGLVIELLRALPKIVAMVWIFYAFPSISGIQLPVFESALVALSVISAAFIAEIIRAGIEAIPKGQLEAAKSLGMSKIETIKSIVLPQVFMRNAPAFMGEFSNLIKDSTLAVIIGVNELLHATSDAAILSYRPMELYTVLGLLFLVIITPLSLLSKKLEFKELVKVR